MLQEDSRRTGAGPRGEEETEETSFFTSYANDVIDGGLVVGVAGVAVETQEMAVGASGDPRCQL